MDISYYKQFEPFWGVWTIDKELGSGSFGKVFRIKRDDFGEIYYSALKVISIPNDKSEVGSLKSEGMDDKSISDYFQSFASELVKEFSLMAKIKGHSNIVSYEDHMTRQHDDGLGYDIFIRMELLTPLNDFLARENVTEHTVLALGADICRALEICTRKNIIHRDIKPENVFVSELGTFKLGDFGVSRIAENATQGMSVKGTVNYMAPEVYKGQPYNASVDIYSLGIMLYKLSNNNRGPFLPPMPEPIKYADRERAESLRMNGTELPDAANASPELMRIIRKAAAYESKDRYQNPTIMLKELEQLLSAYESENPVSTVNMPVAEETTPPPSISEPSYAQAEDDVTLGGSVTYIDSGEGTMVDSSSFVNEDKYDKTEVDSANPVNKIKRRFLTPKTIGIIVGGLILLKLLKELIVFLMWNSPISF